MASKTGWTPIFWRAVPHRTGVTLPDKAAWRMALIRVLISISAPLRYDATSDSSWSASASISLWRYSWAWTEYSAGISAILKLLASWSGISSKMMAFIWTKSITPIKSFSLPSGIWIGIGMVWSFRAIWSMTIKKSEPMRSSLLTKARRGIW